LKATSLAASTKAFVRVKSHHPEVDMVKVGEGADTSKDLKALELEVRDAATVVMKLLTMKATAVKSSLGLGAVSPPPLSHVK
jgi:hypothetical protein